MLQTVRTFAIMVIMLFCAKSVEAAGVKTFAADSTVTTTKAKERKSFLQRVSKPFLWIAKNWSAYDPKYSTPSFYDWQIELGNKFSQETMYIDCDNMNIEMTSKLSSRLGPNFGWRFLSQGFTIDLNAIHGTKRKNEFTFSINSALVNADIIWRRTGGDYSFKKLLFPDYSSAWSEEEGYDVLDVPLVDFSQDANANGYGNYFRNDLTGVNINYFTNHRKYSNPAAFSNSSIQLRSVGSPIIGLGYTFHRVSTELSDIFMEKGASAIATIEEKERINRYRQEGNQEAYLNEIGNLIRSHKEDLSSDVTTYMLLVNGVPSDISVKDLHMQLGYAFNIAFSKRLLLGSSIMMSPAVNWISSNNYGTNVYKMRHTLYDIYKDAFSEVGITEDIFVVNNKRTTFNVNLFLRASLTYNYKRWRVGAYYNNNYYHHGKSNVLSVANEYGSAYVFASYSFGKKKEYRWNGKNREAYIKAALTKKQIIESHDTLPVSNVNYGHEFVLTHGITRYTSDFFNLDIVGCDLVQGPDGQYGQFVIEQGRVADGNDTEDRLRAGTVIPVSANGTIEIKSGRTNGIRPANWLKSQLDSRQLPMNWYPEMLHYALRGKLTLYVRNHQFGTSKPVKLEIDDFYLCHGKESKQFYLMGAKSFHSHSSYSIIGNVYVNKRLCRVYIESKKRGTKNYVYVNPVKKSSLTWMKYVPDDRAVSLVSIPGTHDAGSASLPESAITSMGHTQNFTITEQLQDGIRAFDIRLKKNMKYGHTIMCRDGFEETVDDISQFLKDNPSEFIVAMIGSDEGGKWSDEMKESYKALINKYPGLFVEDFKASTSVGEARGKVLVIKRQEECPFGKLLKFADNQTFEYDCFRVEDEYKMHNTTKKSRLVAKHLREAYENEDPDKWYITFNSIAWGPRHHKPYYAAWGGALNVRKPMNKALRDVLEQKRYNDFGLLFLDFYNDHGDKPELVKDIILSNYHLDDDDDFIIEESEE